MKTNKLNKSDLIHLITSSDRVHEEIEQFVDCDGFDLTVRFDADNLRYEHLIMFNKNTFDSIYQFMQSLFTIADEHRSDKVIKVIKKFNSFEYLDDAECDVEMMSLVNDLIVSTELADLIDKNQINLDCWDFGNSNSYSHGNDRINDTVGTIIYMNCENLSEDLIDELRDIDYFRFEDVIERWEEYKD